MKGRPILAFGLGMMVGAGVMLLPWRSMHSGPRVQQISYNDVLNSAEKGQIADVTIEGNIIEGHLRPASSSAPQPLLPWIRTCTPCAASTA
jgi:hypothetical protein